jgi:hypothetical protein
MSGDDVQEFIEKPGDGIANLALNYFTYGLVGYENGKIGAGYTGKAAKEGIGEVTGANAARKQSMEAADALEEEKQNRAIQRQNELNRDEQMDRSKSSMAAATRATARSTTARAIGAPADNGLLGEKDFLGL